MVSLIIMVQQIIIYIMDRIQEVVMQNIPSIQIINFIHCFHLSFRIVLLLYVILVAPCMNMITHMSMKLRKCQLRLDHCNLDTFIQNICLNVLSASSLHHLNI